MDIFRFDDKILSDKVLNTKVLDDIGNNNKDENVFVDSTNGENGVFLYSPSIQKFYKVIVWKSPIVLYLNESEKVSDVLGFIKKSLSKPNFIDTLLSLFNIERLNLPKVFIDFENEKFQYFDVEFAAYAKQFGFSSDLIKSIMIQENGGDSAKEIKADPMEMFNTGDEAGKGRYLEISKLGNKGFYKTKGVYGYLSIKSFMQFFKNEKGAFASNDKLIKKDGIEDKPYVWRLCYYYNGNKDELLSEQGNPFLRQYIYAERVYSRFLMGDTTRIPFEYTIKYDETLGY